MRKNLFIYWPSLNATPVGWLVRDEHGRAETQQPGWPSSEQAKNAHVILILGAENALCVAAQFPGRKNLHAWRKSAPWIVEDHLAEEPESLFFAIDEQAQENGQHLVAALQKTSVEKLLSDCEAQGIQPDHITLDACLLEMDSHAKLGSRYLLRDIKGAYALSQSMATALIASDKPASIDSTDNLAALDSLAEAWLKRSSINLRQGQFALTEAIAAALRPWKLAAIAASAVAILWTASSVFEQQQIKSQQKTLQAEQAALFKQALPNSRMVKPKAQFQEALKQNHNGHRQTSFLQWLNEASKPLATISDASINSIDHRGQQLVLNLSATQISTVDAVRKQLASLPSLQAEVGAVRAESNQVQLRVTLTPKAS